MIGMRTIHRADDENHVRNVVVGDSVGPEYFCF